MASQEPPRRRRERRLRQFLRHERLDVAMALAETTHHSALRRPKQARGEESEVKYTAEFRNTPLFKTADAQFFAMDFDGSASSQPVWSAMCCAASTAHWQL